MFTHAAIPITPATTARRPKTLAFRATAALDDCVGWADVVWDPEAEALGGVALALPLPEGVKLPEGTDTETPGNG